MKSSFLPNYKQKFVKISALTAQGRYPDNFLVVKFVFSKKATKIDEIFSIDLTLTT